MERLRNRFAKVGLSSVLLFSAGAVAKAQSPEVSPSPTPIVEPIPAVEAPEKIDVSPFLNAVRVGLNYEAEPKFFKRMERRTQNPDKYFEKTTLPDGYLIIYYPKGVDALDKQPKVGVRHTVTNGVGNDYNGVPAGLNFFQTSDDVIIDIGKDGTLESDSAIDLFNFRQIRNTLGRYFVEPDALKDTEWVEKPIDYSPASTYKLLKTDTETTFIGGDQNGFMAVSHVLTEIPVVGTDQVPKP